MATYYVSKRDGNNSNNGTTTTTPVADLWKAFNIIDLAQAGGDGSSGDAIEIIDSETYYVIDGDSGGTGSVGSLSNTAGKGAYPAGLTAPSIQNFTIKAGTDPTTNLESYPVISGKLLNESGSASNNSAVAFVYQEGWTIQGLEIRDFTQCVAIPKTGRGSKKGNNPDSVAGDPTLILKDCLIHHIPSRDGAGTSDGCVFYASDCGGPNAAGEETNVVENCIFYEIGRVVIGGQSQEDVIIRNCLISNYGGPDNGSAFVQAIHLNSTGSVVEHCFISDYENKNHGTSAIHLSGKGTIRYTIGNKLTSRQADGNFYAEYIHSCIANNCTTEGQSVADSSGTVFNSTALAAGKITGETAMNPTLQFNSGSHSSGYFDSGRNSISSEEIGNFLNGLGLGAPPYYYTTNAPAGPEGVYGPQQAYGSAVTRDLSDIKYLRRLFGYDKDRNRSSYAANCAPDIGCYELYQEWSDNNGVTQSNIGDDFTINDAAANQLDNQYKVKLNDKDCKGPSRAPFSKTIKGPPNLRTLGNTTPYKLTK